MYEKPEVKVIEIASEDIIQTSSTQLNVSSGTIFDKPIVFSNGVNLTEDASVTSGNIFQ